MRVERSERVNPKVKQLSRTSEPARRLIQDHEIEMAKVLGVGDHMGLPTFSPPDFPSKQEEGPAIHGGGQFGLLS
jgi:hypothetical protein